jgi:mRNA interferase MazF
MMTMMLPETMIKRGDVVLVVFPNSDLRSAKTRPALIVQADNLNTGIPQIIVAMITSQMSRAGHISRISVLMDSSVGKESGLLSDSVVMTDNLATVTLSAIYRKIGLLPALDIDIALKHTLGL